KRDPVYFIKLSTIK
nr:Chain B, Putative lipoprotein [Tannerella forsythia 92A2]